MLNETASSDALVPDYRGPEERVRDLAEPVARALGCELLDVELAGLGEERTVCITLDHPDGVTLDHCTQMSRRLSPVLDVEDPVCGTYRLEVSSPGLNRPLKREEDYIRHRGQRAKIETRRPIEPEGKQKRFSGILGELNDGRISLELEEGKRVQIPIEQIRKANLIYEFDKR